MKINPVAMDILWHPNSPLNAVSYSKEIEQLREMTDSKYKIGNVQGNNLSDQLAGSRKQTLLRSCQKDSGTNLKRIPPMKERTI